MSPAVLGYPRRSECFWQNFFFLKELIYTAVQMKSSFGFKPTELELKLPSEFPVCPWASKSLRSESETQGLLVWGQFSMYQPGGREKRTRGDLGTEARGESGSWGRL